MEVVGWAGDNVRSENVDLFIVKDDTFTIVRHKPGRRKGKGFSNNNPVE
jgi:hypothetical protein